MCAMSDGMRMILHCDQTHERSTSNIVCKRLVRVKNGRVRIITVHVYKDLDTWHKQTKKA